MRERLPTTFAIAQVILHGIALVCSIATVVIAIYASVRHDYSKQMIGAFVAAFWTMLIDSWEVAALSDKKYRIRRITTGWLGLVEFLTAVLCVTAPILIEMSYNGPYMFECGGRAQQECDDALAWRERATSPAMAACALQWVVGIFHFVFMIFSCIDGCKGK